MNWYKKAQLHYDIMPSDPDGYYDDDDDVDVHDIPGQADQIAKGSGINILSDKSLASVARDKTGRVIGALYTSIVDNIFSFDIVVEKSSQGIGIGKRLVDEAISMYQSYAFDVPDLKIEADVVSPAMQHILASRGWVVQKAIKGHVVMVPKVGINENG